MFTFRGQSFTPADVIARLQPFVSAQRQARIEAVVARRTRTVIPALEGVHDRGNLHAVIRSAEGLGYSALDLVGLTGDAAEAGAAHPAPAVAWGGSLKTDDAEGASEPAPSDPPASAPESSEPEARARVRSSQGAHKWLDVRAFATAEAFVAAAHAEGYRVVATHLAADAVPIAEVDFTRPTALVLGHERDGISDALLARADQNVVLPIDGFIQSYNISVAAALALYHARQDRIARQGHHGDLSPEEQERLTAAYYIRSVPAHAAILTRA